MKLALLVSVLLALLSMECHAADMEGRLVGKKLQWYSAVTVGGRTNPALWDLPINLPTGNSVIPGSVSQNRYSLDLKGPDGRSVSMPLTVSGVQYRLASFSSHEKVEGGNAQTNINGDIAQTTGTGTGDVKIDLTSNEVPFTHYRPILEAIDGATLAKAFEQNNAKQGLYTGHVTLTVPYDYYRQGVRVRNTLVVPLYMSLNYQPARLDDITVTGDGIIAAQYHGYQRVSGETKYTLTATGDFPNGVLMGLQPSTNPDGLFHLQSDVSDSGDIKYNLTCVSGCDVQSLIVNGVPKIDNRDNKAKILPLSRSQAKAQLKVDFTDQPMDTLKSGTYRDAFVLMFEAGL
ncbi:hypothetical protein [Vibrio campbellii]|uniref:hypothetical protein n=1 Tax=Vibrio campbellii TaxID=680 RepID=UPI0006844A16|nr:hypothetical protein [Vibrio campbellii]